MKFRILYTVVEPIRARTEKAATEHLNSISDDLDEFAAQACSGKITAVLQRWVPMPCDALPNNGQWEDVKCV